MSYVVVDTASKLKESPDIIAQGITLAYDKQGIPRPHGWMRAHSPQGSKLEQIVLVGENSRTDDILRALPKRVINNLYITTKQAAHHVKYKEDLGSKARRIRADYKIIQDKEDTSACDSAIVTNALATENEGACIHFNDTAQASLSAQRVAGGNKFIAKGLLASVPKYRSSELLDEPLLIADAGLQVQTSEQKLTKEDLMLNTIYAIATARTLGMHPRVVFGSASNCQNYTQTQYVQAHDALAELAPLIDVELLGYDKSYRSISSDANTHIDSGRLGNEFANNVNQGISLMKLLLEKKVRTGMKSKNPAERLAMTFFGVSYKLVSKFIDEHKQNETMSIRSLQGHLLGSNAFKVHSDITPEIVASGILGASDFCRVQGEYFRHARDLKMAFKNHINFRNKA